MTRGAFLLASLLLVVAVRTGGGQLAAPDPATVQSRAFLDDLAAGRFAGAAARFDEKMTQAMPASKLQAVWEQVVGQVGSFRSVEAIKAQTVRGYEVRILTCAFEKRRLDMRVTVDRAGTVSGLFFAPSEASVPPAAVTLPAGLGERPLTVGDGSDWPLPGTLTRPAGGSGRFPAIVLVHGSGPQDRDETVFGNAPFRDLAYGLALRGVAVFRYDKRTKVHAAKIGASMSAFTVNEETVADARAAVALVAAQPEVDPARVFVLGHSLGGMLVPRIAAGLKPLAGAVVLAGNARPVEDLIVEQMEYLVGSDTSAAARAELDRARDAVRRIKDPSLKAGEMLTVLGAPTPASYWLDLRGYEPAKAAAALAIPLLVLQGERDYQVRTTDFDLWKAALANRPGAAFKRYPSLNHLFIAGTGMAKPEEYQTPGHVSDEVIGDIAAWIEGQVKK
jgi:uncharacterized protein